MTTEQNDTEIKNPAALLANNRALKAEKDALAARVSELEGQLQQAQESHAKAVEVAKAGVNEWKVRWHQEAVLKPLERDIQAAAGVPWKYLYDVVTEAGILKMVTADDGMERPQWLDEHGNPADLTQGLRHHLASMCDKLPESGLDRCVRGTGASGGGATGNQGSFVSAPVPPPAAPAAKPAFGLR
jgi:hypothetical protein